MTEAWRKLADSIDGWASLTDVQIVIREACDRIEELEKDPPISAEEILKQKVRRYLKAIHAWAGKTQSFDECFAAYKDLTESVGMGE